MTHDPEAADATGPRIAYVMSRFPKISETFILFEMLELERRGFTIVPFALRRERATVEHPEAADFSGRMTFGRTRSRAMLLDQLYWLRHAPGRYLGAWLAAIGDNLRAPGFLLRVFFVVPNGASFARSMQAQRVQHVHAHYATHPALAAFVAHRLTGIPYSFTVHAHDLFVQRAMLRRKARNAAFIVTISEYNRTLLTQVAGEMAAARTVVVRTGTDLSRFTPPEQREGVFTILSVASLEPYKGQRHLVEACARLKAQGVPFRCIFVGGGPDRAALEMLTRRLGLARSVRFLGPRAREDVVHQMRSAHVLALPSVTTASGKKEGIPVVLMEALATELAVVATSLSGIPELIEDGVTGVLVPERDARSLADALARLADDPPLRERLGRAGRERVLAGYDIRQSGERLAALFTRARAQTEPA